MRLDRSRFVVAATLIPMLFGCWCENIEMQHGKVAITDSIISIERHRRDAPKCVVVEFAELEFSVFGSLTLAMCGIGTRNQLN